MADNRRCIIWMARAGLSFPRRATSRTSAGPGRRSRSEPLDSRQNQTSSPAEKAGSARCADRTPQRGVPTSGTLLRLCQTGYLTALFVTAGAAGSAGGAFVRRFAGGWPRGISQSRVSRYARQPVEKAAVVGDGIRPPEEKKRGEELGPERAARCSKRSWVSSEAWAGSRAIPVRRAPKGTLMLALALIAQPLESRIGPRLRLRSLIHATSTDAPR